MTHTDTQLAAMTRALQDLSEQFYDGLRKLEAIAEELRAIRMASTEARYALLPPALHARDCQCAGVLDENRICRDCGMQN